MNNTEQYIQQFYKSINVSDPLLLTIELVIEHLDLEVMYWPHSSAIASYNDNYIIFLNDRLSMQQQWQDFGHEMYHFFFDNECYDVLKETYASYGETKADYFAYHFCVPTFMLMQFKGVDVYDVVNKFNVEFDFALRRLEMYHNKILTKGELQIGKRACKI